METSLKNNFNTPYKLARTSISFVLRGFIHFYRFFFSPFFGHNCRYLPSCSAYGIESIVRHGPYKGLWLTIKRICRCHPWAAYGIDAVPAEQSKDKLSSLPSRNLFATAPPKGGNRP